MNKYKIYVQDQLYKTVEAKSTTQAIASATRAIKQGKVSFYDKKKSSNIRIENAN